jgi:hypothetical protein
MPSPYEVVSSQGLSNSEIQKMFADNLRRNREVSQISSLTGDSKLGEFGNRLMQDVQNQEGDAIGGRNAELNRQSTQGYYDQQASQNSLANTMRMLEMQERERHNRAMEGKDASSAANRLDADTRRLSQELTKNNVPEIQSAVSEIDNQLKKYEDGNLPGVGGLANLLPSLGASGREMQDSIAKIRNIILKARSGGAVTPSEADRLLQEFSMRGFNTDEDFIRAWGDFKQAFDMGVANIYAGYSDEVIQQHSENLQRQTASKIEQNPSSQGAINWSDL